MREEMKVYYFTCSGNSYILSQTDRYLKNSALHSACFLLFLSQGHSQNYKQTFVLKKNLERAVITQKNCRFSADFCILSSCAGICFDSV